MRITEAMLCAELFPAYAGVIPLRKSRCKEDITFPRIRGGDPEDTASTIVLGNFSPHTRG